MAIDGYAKFWRKQFLDESIDEKPYCKGYAWTYLWAMANHENSFVNFRGETIPVKEGEHITSFSKLALKFGWSRHKVANFFQTLCKLQKLDYRVSNRYVAYSVYNYHKYQKRKNGMTTDLPTDLPTEGQQKDTNKNDKNEKNNKNRGQNKFVPPSLQEVADYCEQRQNKIDHANFVDFYASKGWYVGKNKMRDWKAAVRNWERREDGEAKKPRYKTYLPKKP